MASYICLHKGGTQQKSSRRALYKMRWQIEKNKTKFYRMGKLLSTLD